MEFTKLGLAVEKSRLLGYCWPRSLVWGAWCAAKAPVGPLFGVLVAALAAAADASTRTPAAVQMATGPWGRAMLALLCSSLAASSLGTQPTTPYSHGGPYVADAGLPPGVQAWYVDALAGSDSNDGRSPDRAWKTAKKALNLDYAPGSMVLFKRGTRHDGGAGSDSVGSPSPNTEQAPFVLGAYGNASLPLPVLVYRLNIRGEHVMARDIDVHQVQLRGRHITLFQCTVHSMPPHRANNLVIFTTRILRRRDPRNDTKRRRGKAVRTRR